MGGAHTGDSGTPVGGKAVCARPYGARPPLATTFTKLVMCQTKWHGATLPRHRTKGPCNNSNFE
eukprot:UN5060